MKFKLDLGFKKNTWIFIASEIIYWGAAPAATTFLTIFVTTRIVGANLESVGFVVGIYWLVRSITAFPIAFITRKINQDIKADIISLASIFVGISMVLLAFSVELWQIIVIQAILGILEGILYSYKWALYPRLIKKNYEEVGWGFHDTITSASSSLFALLFGIFSDKYGLVWLYVVLGVLFAIAGVIIYFVKLEVRENIE